MTKAEVRRVIRDLTDAYDTAVEGWAYADEWAKNKWRAHEDLQEIQDRILWYKSTYLNEGEGDGVDD